MQASRKTLMANRSISLQVDPEIRAFHGDAGNHHLALDPVFFAPDAYSMNWAWRDGKVALQQYRSQHTLDMETGLKEVQELEKTSGPDKEDSAQGKDKERPPENKDGE
jgi:hypothetical protein